MSGGNLLAMSRLQLALNVDDLEQSIAFYTGLFGTEPAKVKPGYANFAVADPALKLVLIENPGHGGSLNHLGVEVADTDTVDAEQSRLAEVGPGLGRRARHHLLLRPQDKFWVEGAPNGEQWEIYTVLEDAGAFGRRPRRPHDDRRRATTTLLRLARRPGTRRTQNAPTGHWMYRSCASSARSASYSAPPLPGRRSGAGSARRGSTRDDLVADERREGDGGETVPITTSSAAAGRGGRRTDRRRHRAVRDVGDPGPPTTTTVNTPCSRPRTASDAALCSMLVRNAAEAMSAAPPITSISTAADEHRPLARCRRGPRRGRSRTWPDPRRSRDASTARPWR